MSMTLFQNCSGNFQVKSQSAMGVSALSSAPVCTFNGITYQEGQTITAYLASTVNYGSTCQSKVETCQTNGTWDGSYAYASCTVSGPASCLFNGQTVVSGASVSAYQNSTVAYGSTCTPETRTCTNGTLSGSYSYASCAVDSPASCLFNGQTIADGQSVTGYQNSTVAYGSTCSSETRTCSNGSLSGSFTYASCAVNQPASCLFNGQTIANGQAVTAYQNSSVAFNQTCVPQARTCSNGTMSGSYAYASCSVSTAVACLFNGQTVADGQSVNAFLNSSVAYGATCTPQTRTCTTGELSGSYAYASCSVDQPASCLFNGQTVANGQTVTAFQASTVAYGSSCVNQTRSCSNGTLSGSYTYSSCQVDAPASCTFNGQTIANGQTVVAYQNSTVAYGSYCTPNTLYCSNGSFNADASWAYASCTVNGPASCLFGGQTAASGQDVTGYSASSVPYGSTCASVSSPLYCDNGTVWNTTNYPYSSCSVNAPISCSFNGTTVADGSSVTAYSNPIYSTGCGWGTSETRTCKSGVLSGSLTYNDCGTKYTGYDVVFMGWNSMASYTAFTLTTNLANQASCAQSGSASCPNAANCTAQYKCPNGVSFTAKYMTTAEFGTTYGSGRMFSNLTVRNLSHVTSGGVYPVCHTMIYYVNIPGKEDCPGMNKTWGDSGNPDPNTDAELNAFTGYINDTTTAFPENPTLPAH